MTDPAAEQLLQVPPVLRRPLAVAVAAAVVVVIFAVGAFVVLLEVRGDAGDAADDAERAAEEADSAAAAAVAVLAEVVDRFEVAEATDCVRDDVLLSLAAAVVAAIEENPAALAEARSQIREATASLADLGRSAEECEATSG